MGKAECKRRAAEGAEEGAKNGARFNVAQA